MLEQLKERTLVIFKPDVIQRQIIGKLLSRFERKGLKIVGMKMLVPTRELVGKHYEADEEYMTKVGEKSIQSALKRGEDVPDKTPLELGQQIREWNIDYLSCGPVLAIVLEGPHIIEAVRKMIGTANPLSADVGTIRSDFTLDSYLLADIQGRTTRTMVHASDSVENANREIPLWFRDDEIFTYSTAVENILYDAGWSK